MKLLVTGAAGFIGFHTVMKLIDSKHEIVALDNINDYYDPRLKFGRLALLGFEAATIGDNQRVRSTRFANLQFVRMSIEDKAALTELFHQVRFDLVINLAAQAGVRYSLENPDAYIASNIQGFFNILEACRAYPVKHLIYASSSSVYGLNEKIPFSTDDNTDHPISLYAATKKSNELMAYTYHHLFKIPMTGLRFFTVYGPWGRPDMAYFSFSSRILEKKEIQIFNHGDQLRDFTFIDDIVNGITQLISHVLDTPEKFAWHIYNLGNNQPVKLIDFIDTLESLLGSKAIRKYLPGQPGDVTVTYADISSSQRDFGYQPSTDIRTGLSRFIDWYKPYYGAEKKGSL